MTVVKIFSEATSFPWNLVEVVMWRERDSLFLTPLSVCVGRSG